MINFLSYLIGCLQFLLPLIPCILANKILLSTRLQLMLILRLITKNKFQVSKETVVLRWWERLKQKFGFIKRVDKG